MPTVVFRGSDANNDLKVECNTQYYELSVLGHFLCIYRYILSSLTGPYKGSSLQPLTVILIDVISKLNVPNRECMQRIFGNLL
jgi:hypothetical protein